MIRGFLTKRSGVILPFAGISMRSIYFEASHGPRRKLGAQFQHALNYKHMYTYVKCRDVPGRNFFESLFCFFLESAAKK